MPRLTDIIKQGKIPEKEKEKDDSSRETISFKDLSLFKKSSKDFITPQDTDRDDSINAQFPKEIEKAHVEVALEEMGDAKNLDWLYKNAYSFVEDTVSIATNGGVLRIDEGIKIINQIVDNLDSIDSLYQKSIYTKETVDLFLSHPVNVVIYAMKIGVGLKYDRERLIKLGMGALLYDIGMVRIPKEILKVNRRLTEGESEIVKKHTRYGYEILLSLGEDYMWLAEIALQHHEREGGQGYPQGLKGDKIAEYAKVIGVVDIYDALIHSRPHRKRFLPYQAVKEIIKSEKGGFHPKIMKVLLTHLSVFPLSSYVKLNSNAIGEVIAISENHPLRPTVQILYDSQGKRVQEKKIINLEDNNPLLYIIDSVFEEDFPV
ncbi:MAG: hypothetical protein COW04_11005 [Deltaproteobacteria bacterium CG12_big_fil_rev_8_21_14_0_65_43_10]|nr:MAG: hypothetical protein AUK23_11840 [Deltaproteobacteria bacterium CG2_30_43_15]PIQ44819.1 MAG: hypothetical protein COW04_11005 [Deltaproteobacteria bacterium CG12_big_fil_rev_8_21_14_0_65_43_10]PIU85087.1 MAG: hypothetical protein COS67_09765 [Deltaproteobacteria bacterium CG06_land_8_20_14_3_00_44_19]PIX22221.1 MAG: hypothetical protein COZ68_12710 [Deltaproteobacteria bacterium CG_4_8_14_3_um_filter_43_13]PIZ20103.1 MAG: hypothetical protein COY50_06530 [Deltaproteobacteria bacterium C